MDPQNQSSVVANFSSSNDEVLIEKFSSVNKSDFDVRDFLHNVGGELSGGSFPIVPTKALIAYLVCVNGIGVILNLFIVTELLKKNTSGLRSLLAQMAASDILMLTVVAVPEMWSHNHGSWNFGPEMCVIYLGFEVVAGTSVVYFLVALCFHAIATANLTLAIKTKKEAEEELLEDITEMKSSRHSLVSRSESATPTKSADAQKYMSPQVPVIFPAMLVWILSASLSVPEFALSTTIDVRSGPSICTFADGYYLTSMRLLLSIFQLLIPLPVLLVSSAVITYKLSKMTKRRAEFRENLVRDSSGVLRLSLFLCCMYLVLSVPRSTLSSVHLMLGGGAKGEGLDRFKTPPLNNSHAPASVPFTLSFFHFLASAVKPIIYVYFTQNQSRKVFTALIKYKKANQEQVL